jgi:hypothetical protein
MFDGPEVSYHQTHSAKDWLSILRIPYTTQNVQRKRRTTVTLETEQAKWPNPGCGYDDDDELEHNKDFTKRYKNVMRTITVKTPHQFKMYYKDTVFLHELQR